MWFEDWKLLIGRTQFWRKKSTTWQESWQKSWTWQSLCKRQKQAPGRITRREWSSIWNCQGKGRGSWRAKLHAWTKNTNSNWRRRKLDCFVLRGNWNCTLPVACWATLQATRNSQYSRWDTQQGVGRRLLEGSCQINDARNSTCCHWSVGILYDVHGGSFEHQAQLALGIAIIKEYEGNEVSM